MLINYNWFPDHNYHPFCDVRAYLIYIWSCAKTTCWSIARKATQCQIGDDYRIMFLLKVATTIALRVLLNFDNTKFSILGVEQYTRKNITSIDLPHVCKSAKSSKYETLCIWWSWWTAICLYQKQNTCASLNIVTKYIVVLGWES